PVVRAQDAQRPRLGRHRALDDRAMPCAFVACERRGRRGRGGVVGAGARRLRRRARLLCRQAAARRRIPGVGEHVALEHRSCGPETIVMTPLPRATSLLLNVAHTMDHMFLLIFATSVTAIAADFGFAHWEDLMPYGVGAFAMFGLCSLPAGRLGDLWGRRQMMLVFFFGMGVAALLVAFTRSAWQLAGALTLL